MCMEFTNLNYAYLKDCFPLLRIDQLLDVIAGYEYLSSLDLYSRYHQILMALEDEKETTFIIDEGTYCYRVMLFGLKMQEPHIKE